METQVIVEYGCEDGLVTVYGAKSEEGWLFWCHASPARNDYSSIDQSDWTGPRKTNLSEALGKNWSWYNPVSIHPEFVPWFRQAYKDQRAQLPAESSLHREHSHRSWQRLLWAGDFHGTWIMNAYGCTFTLNLEQNDDAVTGTMTGINNDQTIKLEGKIKGNEIVFKCDNGQEYRGYLFLGDPTGKTNKLTVAGTIKFGDYQAGWYAKR
jgi:hypothetical protein